MELEDIKEEAVYDLRWSINDGRVLMKRKAHSYDRNIGVAPYWKDIATFLDRKEAEQVLRLLMLDAQNSM